MPTLYEWFATSAAVHGDRPALRVGAEELTYRELEQLATALAKELVGYAGGRAPARIGLLASRSPTAYVGYLAALRSGATVVPLHPNYPAARTAAMVAAGGVALVLADRVPGWKLPVPLVRLDTAALRTIARSEQVAGCLPPVGGDPDQLAYILFTSGTTGIPKGVPIRHRHIDAYLRHVIPRYQLGPESRASQAFDLTFDLSVHDLFATWGAGALLVVPDRHGVAMPVDFVAGQRLTHWFSVPSVVSSARRLGSLPAGGMPTLHRSLFCGEQLTLDQAEAWQAGAPHSVIDNLYGPTELTLSCTHYRLPRDPAAWPRPASGTVPIGEPFAGMEVLVVDELGVPAAEGELCMRGPQRFDGYCDPRDNSGRFVRFENGRAVPADDLDPPDPQLWYQTGDLVRVWQGDALLHLGRLDQQVKISGYRVELGEIETELRRQPGIRDAVVVALPTPGGGPATLAAGYIGPAEPVARLRAALLERLPSHMVPSRFTVLAELPLSANGKLDRRAVADLLRAASGPTNPT